MQSIFCLQGNKPIPEDLWTLKLENCSLRMPEGKQQSQTVAAAHNNNTYRDRLYLKNTATKSQGIPVVHCRFALPDIHQFSLCRTVLLSIECFGIRHELPQKKPSQIPILNNNTRGFTTDRAAIAQGVAASSFFIRFHKATSLKPPEDWTNYGRRKHYSKKSLERQNLEKGWI